MRPPGTGKVGPVDKVKPMVTPKKIGPPVRRKATFTSTPVEKGFRPVRRWPSK